MGTEICRRFGSSIATDDIYAPIIERNTTVPVSRSEWFNTLHDHQKHIRVAIYQGESPDVEDNIYLSELNIPVPPKPRGEVSIEMRLTYDINGILEVEVTVPVTGEKHRLLIEKTPGAMTREEIDRSLKAIAHLKIHPRDHLSMLMPVFRCGF
jgi:molecular chaperone HscC